MLKKILYGLLAILLIIQFFRPTRNTTASASPNHLATKYEMPAPVSNVLKTSCYDCHSNNTVYPWYANIQPVGWWLQGHVNEGKDALNFDEFLAYTPKRQEHKLEEVQEAVTDGWMPLDSYKWIHKDAVLTAEQSKLVADWAGKLRQQIITEHGLVIEKK